MNCNNKLKKIVLLVESSREFGRQLIIGVARYSRIHGPWTFYKEPIDLKSTIPSLTRWRPDGLIIRDSLITEELIKLKIPTILAIHCSSHSHDLPVIRTDSSSIAEMASQHLIEKGLKNFAFCGFKNYDWSEQRGLYFRKFNEEAGYGTHVYFPPSCIQYNEWEYEQKYISKWVNELPKPVGIFACNDDRGQHILEVCKESNIKVPEDVAVVGVDNDPIICDISDPPLTSIALNIESAGYEAAKLIDNMIEGREILDNQILVTPSFLVQRQSSDILAVDDADVAQAIQFIINNAKNKILVEDVVRTTGISKRTLERKFKQTIHRSIYNQIQFVRIDLLSKLLVETDLSISKITSLFDFTDMEHISRYFKREKGVGLREFRKYHKPGNFE